MSTVLVPEYDDEGAVMPVLVPDWILSQIDLSRPEQVHCHERTADVRRSGERHGAASADACSRVDGMASVAPHR